MSILEQRLVPGLVGISTFVDYVYQREMQRTAVRIAGTGGLINQLRSATVTLDFNLLVTNLKADRRGAAEEQVAEACRSLEAAGADFLVVTSGTTSTLTARARERVAIPFLDLAWACWQDGRPAEPVGLLCTRYATAGGLFQAAARRAGAPLILPTPETAERVDQVIFDELISGQVSEAGIRTLGTAVTELATRGAASVILGNTDMTLAAERLKDVVRVPLVDAARVHARVAARVALDGRLEG
jgi:aspartate racemase